LELRGAALLTGARGRPPLAVKAAADAAAKVSNVAAAHPELESIEINPLLVTDTAAIGLDARAVYDQPREGAAPRLKSPRRVINRWISLVPSQIRSTRSSRKWRAAGLSTM